jgi:hypothetical protein
MGHRVICDAAFPARMKCNTRRHFRMTLRPPRWQSVCSDAQVFRKNWINSSANAQQKRRPTGRLLEYRFRDKF